MNLTRNGLVDRTMGRRAHRGFLPLSVALAVMLLPFLIPPAPLSAQVRERPEPVDPLKTPQANPHEPPGEEEVVETRCIDGSPPMNFAEWQAQQPPPAPLQVRQVYGSAAAGRGATAGEVACALVNPAIYSSISASIAQWTSDLEDEGWVVVIYAASFPDPAALRSHLAGIANLDGCLLIGDLPVPWYEVDSSQFPMDVYYMDLDGVWTDSDFDGVYDDHSGDVEPEIWIGRLWASNLDFGEGEIPLLNNYFAKNHAYRTGSLSLPPRALVYLDDDWERNAENWRRAVVQLYPDTTTIIDPATTTVSDYGQRLTENYAWIQLAAHSTWDHHNFRYSDEAPVEHIYNWDIFRIDPHTFFYNLFCCSVARFTQRNYLSGAYLFADSYSLLTVGPTKAGGMRTGNGRFYGLLAEGMPIGRAFRVWFAEYGYAWLSSHYPMVLHGDPTLNPTAGKADTAPPPPANVQASDGTYTDKVQVTWDGAPGAASYEVYRATSADGAKTKLASPTGTSCDDTTATVGATYFYWVTACNSYGCSNFSASDTGYRLDTAPSPPANVQASDGTYTDRVQVTWDGALEATFYEVYRAMSADGARTRLASPTSTSYDDTTATVDAPYFYWVTACNSYGCSDFSASDGGYRRHDVYPAYLPLVLSSQP